MRTPSISISGNYQTIVLRDYSLGVTQWTSATVMSGIVNIGPDPQYPDIYDTGFSAWRTADALSDYYRKVIQQRTAETPLFDIQFDNMTVDETLDALRKAFTGSERNECIERTIGRYYPCCYTSTFVTDGPEIEAAKVDPHYRGLILPTFSLRIFNTLRVIVRES